MTSHLQSVHTNEPEVAQALIYDKNSQERDYLLKHLQTRGNTMHSNDLVPSGTNKLQPFRMLASDCPVDDSVYCIYCLGLFNKKSFATHLEQCKGKSVNSAGGAILQFNDSTENQDCFELKSDNSPKASTGQESKDWKNEEFSYPDFAVDQESANASTWDTSFFRVHPENEALRNSCDDFSPPYSGQTVSNGKSSAKARTSGTRKKRKRRSHVQNQSLTTNDGLVGEEKIPNSKMHVCQHCKATFCSPYTLRRHQYTHTGERPFWCHQCNMGFIQKYRLLKHIFAYHGDAPSSSDQEKLKRAKRRIHGGETSVKDEIILEPTAVIPEDLAGAGNDDTGENIVTIEQDTEAAAFHWEEAGHSKTNDSDTDCWNLLFTS